jgi:hypothetical protein
MPAARLRSDGENALRGPGGAETGAVLARRCRASFNTLCVKADQLPLCRHRISAPAKKTVGSVWLACRNIGSTVAARRLYAALPSAVFKRSRIAWAVWFFGAVAGISLFLVAFGGASNDVLTWY